MTNVRVTCIIDSIVYSSQNSENPSFEVFPKLSLFTLSLFLFFSALHFSALLFLLACRRRNGTLLL